MPPHHQTSANRSESLYREVQSDPHMQPPCLLLVILYLIENELDLHHFCDAWLCSSIQVALDALNFLVQPLLSLPQVLRAVAAGNELLGFFLRRGNMGEEWGWQ